MNTDCCINGCTDEIFDGYCDRCGADLVLDDMLYPSAPAPDGIFERLKSFIMSIIEFIKTLLHI